MEQQQLKKCPIGIQTFDKLREGNFLYVDKTAMILSNSILLLLLIS
mgnify:CR=1 FL=1